MYYGKTDQDTIDLMQANNPNVRGNNGPYMPGTKIRIVVWHAPKYYTTTAVMTTHQVAAKNGLATWSIEVLNNTTRKQWPKGVRVRVA
jgi:phage tail protein X